MIDSEDELEDLLSRPGVQLIEFMRTLEGPLIVLGAGGKMGPSLARLARRAARAAGRDIDVIAVARFSDQAVRESLHAHGIRTRSCDLLDRGQVRTLPDARSIIYMAGRKFGTVHEPSLTWAINTIPPVHVLERFPDARIAAFSTGTVYPLVSVSSGGSRESDGSGPIGEYANACLARERIFEHYSLTQGTAVVLLRLNYAVEPRYGVLVDIGQRVLRGEPVDLTMGYFNCIWQGDANDLAIRSLGLAGSPAVPLNITGTEILSVRAVAERFGAIMHRPVAFAGEEGEVAYLNDASLAASQLGAPATPIASAIEWTSKWLQRGGRVLGRPTHFEVTDGRY